MPLSFYRLRPPRALFCVALLQLHPRQRLARHALEVDVQAPPLQPCHRRWIGLSLPVGGVRLVTRSSIGWCGCLDCKNNVVKSAQPYCWIASARLTEREESRRVETHCDAELARAVDAPHARVVPEQPPPGGARVRVAPARPSRQAPTLRFATRFERLFCRTAPRSVAQAHARDVAGV
jgi:hypothetical protein